LQLRHGAALPAVEDLRVHLGGINAMHKYLP
jgi:hypothetical protein